MSLENALRHVMETPKAPQCFARRRRHFIAEHLLSVPITDIAHPPVMFCVISEKY